MYFCSMEFVDYTNNNSIHSIYSIICLINCLFTTKIIEYKFNLHINEIDKFFSRKMLSFL